MNNLKQIPENSQFLKDFPNSYKQDLNQPDNNSLKYKVKRLNDNCFTYNCFILITYVIGIIDTILIFVSTPTISHETAILALSIICGILSFIDLICGAVLIVQSAVLKIDYKEFNTPFVLFTIGFFTFGILSFIATFIVFGTVDRIAKNENWTFYKSNAKTSTYKQEARQHKKNPYGASSFPTGYYSHIDNQTPPNGYNQPNNGQQSVQQNNSQQTSNQ